MAKIPRSSRRVLSSGAAPGATIPFDIADTGQGREAAALGDIGRGVSDVGSALFEIEMRDRQASDLKQTSTDAAGRKSAELAVEEWKLNNPLSEHTAENFAKVFNDNYTFDAGAYKDADRSERAAIVNNAEVDSYIRLQSLNASDTRIRDTILSTEATYIAEPNQPNRENYEDSLNLKHTPELTETLLAEADSAIVVNQIQNGYQNIIDSDGTKEDARGLIKDAKEAGQISSEQAQSLNSGLNGYASGRDKALTETRNQKTTAGYHEASDILLSGGATINSIKDLGLSATDTGFLESMISKSHNKPDVETRAKGQDMVNGIVMKRSLEQMSDVEAIQATMTEFYDKKTISEETYNWTIDKIQNKYPRELVPTISSKIEAQGADWWGISEGEKVVMERNRDFTNQVDKLLADENFVKKPIQDQIGIIEGEMAALKAGTPLQDPNDIVLDAPDVNTEPRIRVVSPDGVSGTIKASELEEHISRGFKAID